MGIVEKQVGQILIIELEGELMGGPEVEHFRELVDEAIQSENNKVIIDMSKVKWMNSSGLGMLMSALTSLRSSGGDLKLANVSPSVRRPIEITRLDSTFEDFDSIEEAMDTFA